MRNDFLAGYIECALWASSEQREDQPNYGEDFTGFDLAPGTRKKMAQECADFEEANAADLALAYESPVGYNAARAGHDFFLTRNRHGAGFWDRGLGEVGDRLTEAAHSYGEQNLYQDDEDELIYCD
jgi:hypothetical protein